MNGRMMKRVRKYAAILARAKEVPLDTQYDVKTHMKYDRDVKGEVYEYPVTYVSMLPCFRKEVKDLKRKVKLEGLA